MSEKSTVELTGEEWASLPQTAARSSESLSRASSSAVPRASSGTATGSRTVSVDGQEAPVKVELYTTHSTPSLGAQTGLSAISSSKQNCPTAKVAPIVETPSRRTRGTGKLPLSSTLSPKLSRHSGFTDTGIDKLSWDSEEEKRRLKQMAAGRLLRETHSPGRRSEDVTEKFRSLISCLEEKSNIIERQKQTISQLQQECREKDLQLTSSRRGLSPNEIKEAGLLMVDLKSRNPEAHHLSLKLDAAYFELSEIEKKMKTMKEELSAHQVLIIEKQAENRTLLESNEKLKEQIDKLNHYLGDTPTMQEHHSLQKQVTQLRTQCDSLTTKLSRMNSENSSLKEKVSSLSESQQLLSELKRQNAEQQRQRDAQDQRILELHTDNSRLKSEILRLQKLVTEAETLRRQDLTSMRDRHRQRFHAATAKLRKQFQQVCRTNRKLETQLLRSSDMMKALDCELRSSQGTISELNTAITDLVTENQTLVEKNLTLKEAQPGSAGVSPVPSDDDGGGEDSEGPGSAASLTEQLITNLAFCVDDLDSVVDFAHSLTKGDSPNMSRLLGVRDISPAASSSVSMEEKLSHVHKIRRDIEKLRSSVSDQYATQLATQSQCHVQ